MEESLKGSVSLIAVVRPIFVGFMECSGGISGLFCRSIITDFVSVVVFCDCYFV